MRRKQSLLRSLKVSPLEWGLLEGKDLSVPLTNVHVRQRKVQSLTGPLLPVLGARGGSSHAGALAATGGRGQGSLTPSEARKASMEKWKDRWVVIKGRPATEEAGAGKGLRAAGSAPV